MISEKELKRRIVAGSILAATFGVVGFLFLFVFEEPTYYSSQKPTIDLRTAGIGMLIVGAYDAFKVWRAVRLLKAVKHEDK